jgi:hypothetical protein
VLVYDATSSENRWCPNLMLLGLLVPVALSIGVIVMGGVKTARRVEGVPIFYDSPHSKTLRGDFPFDRRHLVIGYFVGEGTDNKFCFCWSNHARACFNSAIREGEREIFWKWYRHDLSNGSKRDIG